MLQKVEIEDFNIAIDPENNFWTVYDGKIPDEILKLYQNLRDELCRKMEKYRTEIDFNTVYLNVTERCNANCPYCYIPKELRRSGEEMEYDVLCSILNTLSDINVRSVVFHGAEPLLSKKTIFRAIEDFKNDFIFGIQTNGFLLTEEDAEFLKEMKVNVGISFDSPKEDVEDFLRGKGHYKKVVEILEWFKNQKGFNVITTITKYNYTDLSEMIDFLAGKVRLVLMNPVRGSSAGGRELRPDPKVAAHEFIRAVERSIWHTKNGRRIVIGDFANIILGIVAPYSRVLQCDISPCGGGRRFFAVTPTGVYPCGEFIGISDFRSPLEIIKDKEELKKAFESVRKRRTESIEECKDCAFRNICGSPCPAEIYAEKGSFLNKSPFCEFYKAVIEHAFKIIKRGDLSSVIEVEKLRKVYEIVV